MNQLTELSQSINQATSILHGGGLVAFPTETVYGLGADALNPKAVKRIFTTKGRPADHPLIVHISDVRQMLDWAQNIPDTAWQLAEVFWPGPLTLILPRLSSVPSEVTGGLNTVALRVPDHPVALALLSAFRGGIAAPSANCYGRVSPTSAQDVREELEDGVDLVLDGGRCFIGIESTIIDLSTKIPRVLRPGKITQEEISFVLGKSVGNASKKSVAYPGSKPSHYAPRARVILSSWDNINQQLEESLKHTKRVGLMAQNEPETLPKDVIWLPLLEDVNIQARDLYYSLRNADHLGLQVLVVVMPSDVGIGHAVCDRLRRAAGLGS